MKFWDASAIVPLLVAEASTPRLLAVAAEDPAMLVWWSSEVECASAIARVEREAAIDASAVIAAFARLSQLKSAWHEIDPSDAVRETANRLLRVHPLRAADALQLAAAFAAAEGRPPSLELITLDDRLSVAARKEGFAVVEIASSDRSATVRLRGAAGADGEP
jgi:predicted nucleic acid-binding protein